MVFCIYTCALMAAFIGGLLHVHLAKDDELIASYLDTMTPEQRSIYEKIKQRRRQISTTGFLVGLGGALALHYLVFAKRGITFTNSCMTGATAMVIHYFWYMLAPKGPRMIQYLRDDQKQDWMMVGQMFQRNYHMGLLLAGAAAAIFLYSGI